MFYKWLLLLLFLPNLLLSQKVSTPLCYTQNELWGLGTSASPITPAAYDTLIPIKNSINYIARKHKAQFSINTCGVISVKGKLIVPHEYLNITPSNKDLIVSQWVNGEKRLGVLSYSNETILAIRFKAIQTINGFWVVTTRTHEIKLYNTAGEVICGINADSVASTDDPNFLYTFKDGRVGLLSTVGQEVSIPKFVSISKMNGKWKGTPFPQWQLIQDSDTSFVLADSVRIWDHETLIKGYSNLYYIEKEGKRLSQTYNELWPTKFNIAITKNSDRFGALSINGKVILPNLFNGIYIEDGYAYAKKEQKWSLYDSLGVKKTVFNYDSIGIASEGLFPIMRKGKWGFMNRQGVEVIHCIYDKPSLFMNGKAIISYFGREGIINAEGNWMVKPVYDKITDYSFDVYTARLGNQYYLKNYNGEIIYFSPDPITDLHQLILKQDSDGYIKEFYSSERREENWKVIYIDGKYGFEGNDGLLKITYRYDSLLPFNEGLAAFKLRGKWGFINRNEQIVIQPLFLKVSQFSHGVAKVRRNNTHGLINTRGKFILKPDYDKLERINNNIWIAYKDNKKGLYSHTGAIILHPLFETITYVNDQLIIVSKNGKYGIVNNQGANIVPRIYDYIGYNSNHKTLLLKKNPEKLININ